MSRKSRYKQAKERRESGGFVSIPHVVLRSQSYASLGPYAVKLLNDLLAQFRGNNNGDLCMAWALMRKRGWRSKSTLNKYRKELLSKNWIEITRQGGLHRCSLYAVMFYAIDECGGKLEVKATRSPKSTWRLHEPRPLLKSVA